MTQQMIDVSSNNHAGDAAINWRAVRGDGYSAVMVKATEGTGYVNPWLHRDAQGAHAAGLHVGYYHFAQPALAEGAEQSAVVMKAIEGLPRDLGVSLDLEVPDGLTWAELAQFAHDFLAAIPPEVKYRTLYTSASWLAQLGHLVRDVPVWIASWGLRPRQQCWAWQSGQRSVLGIPGDTDVSTLYL